MPAVQNPSLFDVPAHVPSAADTRVRRNCLIVLNKAFGLSEQGCSQNPKYIFSRKGRHYLGKSNGFTLGDGGAYIKCLKTNLSTNCEQVSTKPGLFFTRFTDPSHSVKIYFQNKNVESCRNPPRGEHAPKYSDPQNRSGGLGYANYPTDCVFFDPDEVFVCDSEHPDWNNNAHVHDDDEADLFNTPLPIGNPTFGDLARKLVPSDQLHSAFWADRNLPEHRKKRERSNSPGSRLSRDWHHSHHPAPKRRTAKWSPTRTTKPSYYT